MTKETEQTLRNWLLPRLRAGEQPIGTFVDATTPVVCEVLAAAGLDWVILDAEHSAIGGPELQGMLAACDAARLPAIVRVPGVDASAMALALDAGAAGVLVPRVSSAEQAAEVAAACRYPPQGARGLGPGRASRYGLSLPAYLAEARAHTLVAIQVETRAAVERLDTILAVEGIDMIFIGPADLSSSYGFAEGPRDPRLMPIVEDVLDRAARAGRLTGMFAPTPELAARWIARKVDFVALSTDLLFLAEGVRAALQSLARLRAG